MADHASDISLHAKSVSNDDYMQIACASDMGRGYELFQ